MARNYKQTPTQKRSIFADDIVALGWKDGLHTLHINGTPVKKLSAVEFRKRLMQDLNLGLKPR